jgi:hypothetical protein
MKKLLKFSGCAVLLTAVFIEGSFAQNAWINEIHYDNANSDVNESVEVVIQDAESYNLSDFSVVLYNGGNGATYNTKTLDLFTSGIVAEGYSFFYYVYPVNGLQNGAPDGLALSYQGILINGQFLSYEGTFTATNGPANGLLSSDIGVSEPGTDPAGYSLQLSGIGWIYDDFTWLPPTPETRGQLNNDQAFGQPPTPEPTNYPADFLTNITGLVAYISWTDAVGEQLPENYLVMASDQDSTIAPADGEMQPDLSMYLMEPRHVCFTAWMAINLIISMCFLILTRDQTLTTKLTMILHLRVTLLLTKSTEMILKVVHSGLGKL